MTNDEFRMTNGGLNSAAVRRRSVIRHSSFRNSSFTPLFLAHSFRLRDPWQCEATDGGVRWSRGFHRPTGLEDDDALWLVCSGLPPGATVAVNGQLLSQCASGVSPAHPSATGVSPVSPADGRRPNEFEVTSLLAESNRIEIVVLADPSNLQSPASSLQPAHPPFPYDVRLAIVGCS